MEKVYIVRKGNCYAEGSIDGVYQDKLKAEEREKELENQYDFYQEWLNSDSEEDYPLEHYPSHEWCEVETYTLRT